jgi:hypothetical protein
MFEFPIFLHTAVLFILRSLCLYFAWVLVKGVVLFIGVVGQTLRADASWLRFWASDATSIMWDIIPAFVALVLLARFNQRLAGWLVPKAVGGCIACGHPLPAVTDSGGPANSLVTCSECGLKQATRTRS